MEREVSIAFSESDWLKLYSYVLYERNVLLRQRNEDKNITPEVMKIYENGLSKCNEMTDKILNSLLRK